MNKRVLIYLNITEKSLIEVQEKVLLRYCKTKEWDATKVSSDFEEMLEAVKGNEVDVVLVDALLRLSKSEHEVLHLIHDVFMPNNVALVSISDNLDTSTALGKLKVLVLELEAQQRKEELKSIKEWLDRKNNKTKE